jgi:hypothetical protein
MLEIVKSNSETSNNSIRLIAVALIISIARLAAIALIILIIATPFKLTTLAILIIATLFKRNTCKVARGRAASSAS